MYITHTRPAKLKILFSSTGPTGLHVKKIAVKPFFGQRNFT